MKIYKIKLLHQFKLIVFFISLWLLYIYVFNERITIYLVSFMVLSIILIICVLVTMKIKINPEGIIMEYALNKIKDHFKWSEITYVDYKFFSVILHSNNQKMFINKMWQQNNHLWSLVYQEINQSDSNCVFSQSYINLYNYKLKR